ncbi:DNA recombination protein RmuC [Sulfurimonas crateris]|uniref:DNA recombination protein RmuC n=1 Tax=Sulfurimonas crateris TaxID=2574727 RepID=A0A4U2ZBQ5_9BACT|nr:DNA recombination protein RmuC [Sulfurimonas crateris]TKI70990.1 DNA recombination protein RmuC [Sulfurimonas crateris]
MFEALYVAVGVLFGALGVWIAIVGSLKNALAQEREKSAALLSQNAVLQERIEGINEKNREKFELLEQSREQMRLEFQELAQKILENNSQKFSLQNQENISKMIEPMREQFREFKKQIDDVYIKEAKDRSMLQAEIRSIKEINHQMSKDAKNLTKALKGESKKQGVWGEMVLESVLENSGLRLGKEYEREVSLEHESDGSRYRPDVLVHLPDNRDIIIDAKTSLTAYERYASAESEEQKEQFAIEHLSSIKKHIKELSSKDYTNLKGVKTLDFIFMFIPIESALLMAMEYDGSLFDHAFKRNVILVGPTTLMVSLRAVENSWKYERQQRNAQEIAKRAGLLFDKFAGFIESVEKLGNQITTVQKTYDETFAKLHSGSGSITSQFQKLQKLGAANSKNLPEYMLED